MRGTAGTFSISEAGMIDRNMRNTPALGRKPGRELGFCTEIASMQWAISTFALKRPAALSEDRKTLTIAVLNPSDSKQSMKLAVNGVKLTSQGKLWQMAPSSLDAVVAVGKTPEVSVEEHSLGAIPGIIEAPPFSVNIYSYSWQ